MTRVIINQANLNLWQQLRQFTPARIALGRSGISLPTRAVMEIGLAHAQARDAVHIPLDVPALTQQFDASCIDYNILRSAAKDRYEYLRRPDLGRCLDVDSRELLSNQRDNNSRPDNQTVFVIADGLSATAVTQHAIPLLQAIQTQLQGEALNRVIIATQARVALGDEIASLLSAEQVVMLIGERPGLSSPDSLGVYFTHQPRIGCTDADRNCISNIRPDGLSYQEAARRLVYLMRGARRLGCSGIKLKDDSQQLEQLPNTY
jgi:ethanolamine ammonia-lyase small subunit